MHAPKGPYGSRLSPHRIFGLGSISLSDVKRVKNHFGVKVNDVVVALVAGAVRNHLAAHGELPEEPLLSQIPVSVRTEEERGTFGNQVSIMIVPIPTHLDDPAARIAFASEKLSGAKERHKRPAGQGASGRHDLRPAGAPHPGIAGDLRADREPAHPAPLQPGDLQRPRAADGHLQRRRPARGALPALDNRRRNRPQRHRDELSRRDRHRDHGRPRPRLPTCRRSSRGCATSWPSWSRCAARWRRAPSPRPLRSADRIADARSAARPKSPRGRFRGTASGAVAHQPAARTAATTAPAGGPPRQVPSLSPGALTQR